MSQTGEGSHTGVLRQMVEAARRKGRACDARYSIQYRDRGIYWVKKVASNCSDTLPESGWISERFEATFGPINTFTPVHIRTSSVGHTGVQMSYVHNIRMYKSPFTISV